MCQITTETKSHVVYSRYERFKLKQLFTVHIVNQFRRDGQCWKQITICQSFMRSLAMKLLITIHRLINVVMPYFCNKSAKSHKYLEAIRTFNSEWFVFKNNCHLGHQNYIHKITGNNAFLFRENTLSITYTNLNERVLLFLV